MPLWPRKEDQSFIQSFQKGEENAFDQLFRDFSAALNLYAFRIMGDKSVAEDIVQDCFVSLWERRKRVQTVENIKDYLYSSIYNLSVSYIRKQVQTGKVQAGLPEQADMTEANIEELIITAETARYIHQLIELLPERMQQVVRLYYLEEKSYHEIGALLHTDPETVRNQRFKAIQFIRKTISAS